MSETMSLIKNIHQAAIWHKKNCLDSQCGVSIFLLMQAANQLAKKLTDNDEQIEFLTLVWET